MILRLKNLNILLYRYLFIVEHTGKSVGSVFFQYSMQFISCCSILRNQSHQERIEGTNRSRTRSPHHSHRIDPKPK